MTTSLSKAAAVVMLLVAGCARGGGPAEAPVRSATIEISTSTEESLPPLRVLRVAPLSKKVNLREALLVQAMGADVGVTFALGREGATYVLDPESLEPHAALPHAFPRAGGARAPLSALETARVPVLAGTFVCWTDPETSRVLARLEDLAGPRSEAVAVSLPTMDAIGSPRAVSVDGRHVVVAFFASTDAGFELVVASLEANG